MLCPLTLEQDFPSLPSQPMRCDDGGAVPGCRRTLTEVQGHEASASPAEVADGALVTAWLKGDAESLRVLVDRYRVALFRLALQLCGNHENAEDLSQEAFLRAISHLYQFDVTQPFRPWLFRIAGRLYIDQLRASREYPEPVLEPPMRDMQPDDELFIENLLGCLSTQHRAILVLRELGGLSYEELSQHFQVPVGTIRSRLAHARDALRTAYARMNGR